MPDININCESLASAYEQIIVNGEIYWVVLSLPENKVLVVHCGDALGGAAAVPVYLVEKPA